MSNSSKYASLGCAASQENMLEMAGMSVPPSPLLPLSADGVSISAQAAPAPAVL